eukprot:scaffold57922_cov81-Phaeocystis_antarctica.AAC.1
MPHCDGCGFGRLVIVVTAAQKANEARPSVLRAERDVAVARERRFDALAPSRRCDGDALISAGMKQEPVCWNFGGCDVAVQPRRDAGVDGCACRAKDGGGLVCSGLREVELVRSIWLALQRTAESERADDSHPVRRLIREQA